MNTLKGWITTTCLVAILMVSASTARASVIIAGASSVPSCAETSDRSKVDYSIIIAGLTGTIIAGLTGIIIAGVKSEPVENCSVIIAG